MLCASLMFVSDIFFCSFLKIMAADPDELINDAREPTVSNFGSC
jgi:hypothetical protein